MSTVEVLLSDAALGNQCVGQLPEGPVVFVRGPAVPGDRVRARVTRKRKRLIEAELLEILEPAPQRIAAPCPLFDGCGGCSWQPLPYAQELAFKEKQIRDQLTRIGGFRELNLQPALAAPAPYGYRNKLTFSCRSDAAGSRIGYRPPGDPEGLIDVPDCLLATEGLREAYHHWREHLPAEASRLVLREDSRGEIAVLTGPNPEALQQIAGPELLEEQLGSYRLAVHPAGFFQVYPAQAERLFTLCGEILEELLDGRRPRIMELFCGAGALSVFLAPHAKVLVGFESDRQAVKQADLNLKANGFTQASFRRADLYGASATRLQNQAGFPPDVIVTDPPRSGMSPTLMDGIRDELKPRLILYVSCNPATLARDAKRLCESKAYQLTRIHPADLFPRTGHIECLAVFERSGT